MKQQRFPLAARLFCLLLAICLLPVLPALAQETARKSQDLPLGEGRWFQSFAVLGDQVFFSGEKIWSWSPGEEDLREVFDLYLPEMSSRYPSLGYLSLAAGEGKLYGLSTDAAKLYDIVLTGDGAALENSREIDVSPMADPNSDGDYVYYQGPAQTLVQDGRLYLVMRMYGHMGIDVSLISYDLTTGGAPMLHQGKHIQQLAPFGQGKLLALVMDESHMYGGMGSATTGPSLAVLDTASDTLRPLFDLDLTWDYNGMSLAHDPANGYTYLASGSDIYRLDKAGKRETCAYLPPAQGSFTPSPLLSLLSGDRLVYINARSLALRSANPADLPTGRLTIYGSGGDEQTHLRTIAKMDGVNVAFVNPHAFGDTAQSLGQMLIGGAEDIDIYIVSSNYVDLATLMSKGYAANLSDNPGILTYLDSVYPMLAQSGKDKGGQPMMVPISLGGELMGYYPLLMEQTGLDVPKDYYELADFLESWQRDSLGDEYPNYMPIASPDFFQSLLGFALQLYAGQRAATGQPFSFSDPLLLDMLSRAETLRLPNSGDRQQMDAIFREINNKAPLLDGYYGLDIRQISFSINESSKMFHHFENGLEVEVGNTLPLLLPIKEGMEAHLPLQVVYMAVNPKSQHLDLALRYVENYVNSLEPTASIMLSPDKNEGIESPWLAQREENMAKYVAQLEEEITKAEGAQKTQLEHELQSTLESQALDRENTRWDISPTAIALYRSLMEEAYVSAYGDLNMIFMSGDFQKLTMRYVQGQMPLAQFLQEAEGKLRLMRLEGE